MKYSIALAAAMAAFASAAADLSVFPECSRQCILDGVAKATTCGEDYACVCEKMGDVKNAALNCVVEKCGIDVGVGQVLPAAEKFCEDVAANPPAPSSSAAPEPPKETSKPAEPTKTAEEPPKETSKAPEPTDDDEEEEPATSTGGGSIITSVAPPTKTEEPPKPTSSVATGGAAGKAMGLGMAVLGAIAAL